ncbi:hypothetical protein HP456_20970 [Bacillus haikouensis]|uniref:hypothetical protein n=1 Tax=Bacillus haikouensis TaxID=1510468 RepID=UPI001554DABF|nr:hypothetical protein [Bacillus haikouensis]NQD68385.1 hypothetical protein [Bacillus haikouensis]
MKAFREFSSSFLLIVSWLIFLISAYLLYWTVVMPGIVIVPFLVSIGLGWTCRHLSRRWNHT